VAETLQGPDSAAFRRWRLAARALLDMHRDRREPDVAKLAVEKLESIIASNAGPKERADAGETLGWLGDRRDLERFVPIPKGNYGTSQGKIAIKGLEMGACPVTNRWFAQFVKNGYSDPRFWGEQGQHWLKYTGAKHPLLWHERSWTCPNSPVVGVCWYEADAFCRWLTRICDDGFTYRLPDEREWEATAAGFKNREYPWGKWAENLCNTSESGIEKPSPVGIFPKGDTPEGISDLSGNVWEWTSSDYHGGQSRSDFAFDEEMQKLYDKKNWDEYSKAWGEKDRQLPVLRGGSWVDLRNDAQCTNRFRIHPNDRVGDVGFRCVRTK
jgi:formylglycine-generating enzyme required for sulfatase activity